MMASTTFVAFILIFTLASNFIIIASFLPFSTMVPHIIHKYTALAFRPTKPNSRKLTTTINHNHPPVANAGINQIVNETDTVTLNGIAIDSDPNDKLTYSWTQIAGPTVKLHNSNTTNPSFTAPTAISDRVLKFVLTAKDDKGATSNNPAIVAITVKHINHPPIADGGQEIS